MIKLGLQGDGAVILTDKELATICELLLWERKGDFYEHYVKEGHKEFVERLQRMNRELTHGEPCALCGE